MVYVIVYDISNDKCRYRIARYLESQGQRIQESAFECRLNELEVRRVIDTLQRWIEKHGNIRIYPVCQSCMRKTVGIGDVRKIVGGEGYAIF